MALLLLTLLSVVCAAGDEHGVTARFVPEQVRPGDVFELRVEMTRAEYGRFELQVPPHGSLHRVAVESEPVKLEDGRYRQRESWMLQADRSGEIVIEGAAVVMKTASGEEAVELPPLRVEVMPWGVADKSAAPVGWPVPNRDFSEWPRTHKGVLLLVLGLVMFVLVAWFIGRKLNTKPKFLTPGMPLETFALEELDAGVLRSAALERLLLEKGDAWSAELREVVSGAVYAGRGEAGEVAIRLRKEVGQFEPEAGPGDL